MNKKVKAHLRSLWNAFLVDAESLGALHKALCSFSHEEYLSALAVIGNEWAQRKKPSALHGEDSSTDAKAAELCLAMDDPKAAATAMIEAFLCRRLGSPERLAPFAQIKPAVPVRDRLLSAKPSWVRQILADSCFENSVADEILNIDTFLRSPGHHANMLKSLIATDPPVVVTRRLDLLPSRMLTHETLAGLIGHSDKPSRRVALRVLADRKDRKALGELLAAYAVAKEPMEISDDLPLPSHIEVSANLTRNLSILKQLPQHYRRNNSWKAFAATPNDIRQWGAEIGRQLLGGPPRIIWTRDGLGYTRSEPAKRCVKIWVNPVPVLAQQQNGDDILRALIIHELGHHLWDQNQPGARHAWEKASEEGVRDLFNLMADERLERAMRSVSPEFGRYFDRLASSADPSRSKRAHRPVRSWQKLISASSRSR